MLAMMLQRFDIVMDDPSYQLEIAETLTIKPHGLKIRARAASPAVPAAPRDSRAQRRPRAHPELVREPADDQAGCPTTRQLLVLYGSNTGSCEMFARRIGGDAPRQGYAATVAQPRRARRRAVAASVPVDRGHRLLRRPGAGQRKKFLSPGSKRVPAASLAGVRFAVFGCGNRQWARTYQFDPQAGRCGARRPPAPRLRERGEADAGGDFFGAFEHGTRACGRTSAAALGRAVDDKPATAGLRGRGAGIRPRERAAAKRAGARAPSSRTASW